MSRIKVSGWIQAGIMGNEYGNQNAYDPDVPNAPADRNKNACSGNSYLLGTEHASDFKLDQIWLSVTREMDAKHGLDWGFQFDMAYGTDAKYAQSFGDQSFDYGWGDGDYYAAIVQMYAEVGYKRLTARVGKFGANMVHEPLAANYTFFYSNAYACYSSILTLCGATLEYAPTDKLTLLGGWTPGYHSTFENKFEDNAFYMQATYRPTKRTSIRYSLYSGTSNGLNRREDALDFQRNFLTEEVLAQAIVFSWALNDRWSYMIEGHWSSYDYDHQATATTHTFANGINQHLIYTISPKWALGLRAEWLKAKGTMFDAEPFTGAEGTDIYEVTLGANWNPRPWLNIRPELRYDWTDYTNGFGPFDNATRQNQLSGGVAMLVRF